MYEIILPVPRQARISAATLVDALIAVVVREGLDAVSIRAVAREADVSIGTVQYYFATKDDLLLAAYGHVIDEVVARARAIAAGDPTPAEYIRALLFELLPLDDRRRTTLQVTIAFTARSTHSPRLAEFYTSGYRALTDAIAGALRRAADVRPGRPRPTRSAPHAKRSRSPTAWAGTCSARPRP